MLSVQDLKKIKLDRDIDKKAHEELKYEKLVDEILEEIAPDILTAFDNGKHTYRCNASDWGVGYITSSRTPRHIVPPQIAETTELGIRLLDRLRGLGYSCGIHGYQEMTGYVDPAQNVYLSITWNLGD